MNNTIKWHKGNGPAFNPGEEWKSISGKSKVTIVSIRKFGDGKHDYIATYLQSDGTTSEKDVWDFQVRYQHIADRVIKEN